MLIVTRVQWLMSFYAMIEQKRPSEFTLLSLWANKPKSDVRSAKKDESVLASDNSQLVNLCS